MRGISIVELPNSDPGRAENSQRIVRAVMPGWLRKPAQNVMIGLLAAITASSAATAQSLAPQSAALPGTSRDQKFEKYVAGLDLEDSKRFQFHAKTSGTSIGFKISRPGKRKKALFLARNTSTVLEGEVVSYRLSRLLGVSKLYNPVDYYELGPKAIARFRSMLRDDEADRWRRFNTRNLYESIDQEPNRLLGIVKYRHKRRSQPVEQLADGGNRLNSDHVLAGFLRASSEQPPTRKLRLAGVGPDKKTFPYPSESAAELARQLSIIFVVDMLTEQWDRFSGGNVEVYALKSGRLRFVARDNGGAGLEDDWKWYQRYAAWVTRFDSTFITQLAALNEMMQAPAGTFGFSSAEQLKTTLGFRRDRSFRSFKRKLRRFIERDLPDLERRFGDRVYFAPVEHQVAGVDRAPPQVPGQSTAATPSGADKPSPSGQLRVAAANIAGTEPVWIDIVKPPRRVKRSQRRSTRVRRVRRVSRNREPPERESEPRWQKTVFGDW